MERRITVSHVNGVWSLEVCGVAEPIMFLSGGRAEAAARMVARALTRRGFDTRVEVRDRQDLLVGNHRYFGDESVVTT